MTTFNLSLNTISLINAAINNPGANNVNYLNAYNAIYNDIKNQPGVDPGTVQWFSQAGLVNTQLFNPTAAGTWIHDYLFAAAKVEGVSLTDPIFQQVSNKIATTVFKQIVDNNGVFDTDTFSPSGIVSDDAGAGMGLIQKLFPNSNLDFAAWGGTLFATTTLNDPSYYTNYNIDTTSPSTLDCQAINAGFQNAVGGVAQFLLTHPTAIASALGTAKDLDRQTVLACMNGGDQLGNPDGGIFMPVSQTISGTANFTPTWSDIIQTESNIVNDIDNGAVATADVQQLAQKFDMRQVHGAYAVTLNDNSVVELVSGGNQIYSADLFGINSIDDIVGGNQIVLSGQGMRTVASNDLIILDTGGSASLDGSDDTVDENAGSTITFNSGDRNTFEDAVDGETLTVSGGAIGISGDPDVIGGNTIDTFSVNSDGSMNISIADANGTEDGRYYVFKDTGALNPFTGAHDGTIVGKVGYNNILTGFSGDTLVAQDGTDTLIAGPNNTLDAGSGADTFVFGLGDGAVTIYDSYRGELTPKSAGQDVLRLGPGISPETTQISRTLDSNQNSLVLSFGNGDQATLYGYFQNVPTQSRPTIVFANGVTWDYAAVTSQLVFRDTTAGGNTMLGLPGVNNRMIAAANDTVTAGNLNDTITAAAGDTINAGSGVDTYIFNRGCGPVKLNELTLKTAGISQDVLQLGAGITPTGTSVMRQMDNSLILSFGGGDQVTIPAVFSAYTGPTGQQFSVQFADGTTWSYGALLNHAVFADTTSGSQTLVGLQGVNNNIVGAANDVIRAGNLTDTVTAGRNDILYAGAGNDTFVVNAGDGAVTLYENANKAGGANQDVLQIGSGITAANTQIIRTLTNSLILSFGNGDQVTIPGYFAQPGARPAIAFADGTVWNFSDVAARLVFADTSSGGNVLAGLTGVSNTIVGARNDTINAGNLNDTITAGPNDTLNAGAGVDTFIFNAGDGAVTLRESATKTAGINQDILRLGAGILTGATQVARTLGNDLVLSFGNGDQVTIPAFLSTYTSPTGQQFSVQFADGTTWTYGAMLNRMVFQDTGTGGRALFGLSGVNNMIIGASSDTIYAGDLNDTITAGLNDTLNAGVGIDTFIFNAGDGAVTLQESGAKTAGSNQDILRLGAGITEGATQVTRTLSNGLVLSLGNGDQVTIPNYFSQASAQLSVAFADGTTWNYATLANRVAVFVDTSSGGNFLTGLSGVNNTITGAPSDTIRAGNLNDSIIAGRNDTLYAGAGVDTFIFNQGSGAVVLRESFVKTAGTNQDILQLGAGITEANTQLTRTSSNDLVLSFGNGDQVTIPYYFNFAVCRPTIAFADGTQWNFTTIASALGYGAPTVTQTLAAQTAMAGTPFSFALPGALFSDAGANDSLTLSATLANGNPLPSWLTFNPTTGTFSGTPTDQNSGALAVRISASDVVGLTASATLNVQVNPTYQAPTASQTLAAQTIAAGNAWSYTLPAGLFNEAVAGDTLTYQATLANGNPLPAWLSFDPVRQTFSGTPTDQTTGALALTITATDMGGLKASTTLNVQVNPTYQAPTASGTLATQTISAGNAWSYALPATLFSEAVAGDTLTYKATLANGNPLPGWLTFDPLRQTFNGTPTDQTTGTLALTVTATDMGGLATSTALNVQVNPTYQAPTVTQTLPSQSVTTGTAWSYSLPATLFNEVVAGDALFYRATLVDGTPLPGWLSFDATNLVFSGTPPSGTTGTVGLNITATDLGGLSASTALNIVPSAPATAGGNTPVVTQSLSSPTIAAGTFWSYALPAGLFSESAAGDTLAYTATLANGKPLPSWLTFDPVALTFSGTPTDQTTGALQLEITATEQGGLSATAPLNVTVNPVYAAPTATVPLFQMAALGQPWQYTLPPALFSESIAGDTLTYSATMADGSALPSWLTFDPVGQTFTGTPPGQVSTALNIAIKATDMGGLSSSTALTVQLQQNVLSLGDNQAVAAPTGQSAIEEANQYSNVTADDGNHTLLMAGGWNSATLGNGANWAAVTGWYNTLKMGDGDNVVQETGWNDTITLGNGNNTIGGESSATITAGGGNNVINTTGGSQLITVGDGANNITVTGSFVTVNAGNGDNVISANGAFENVTVGSGNNTITAKGYYEFVTLGDGTDTVAMTVNTAVTVGHGTYILEDFGNLRFGADTSSDALWFQRVGQDLQITELGVGGTVTAKNWYAASPARPFAIFGGDGKSISSSGVDQLVQAMAAFAPPAPGATSYTPAEQQALAPLLAANWR